MKGKIILIYFIILTTFIFSKNITIWFEYEGIDELKSIAIEFEKEYPDIKVNIIKQKRIPDKIFTAFKGNGELPDLILLKNDDVGRLKEAYLIESLDEIKKEFENSLIKDSFEAFKENDHYFGVPFYFDTQILYYNKKILSEYNIHLDESYTFEDLLKVSNLIKKDDKYIGLAWGANSPYWFPTMQWAFGKKELYSNGRVIVNDSNTLKAINFINKVINVDKSANLIERQGLISGLKNNKIGMIFFGSFMIPDFIKSNTAFGILPLPYIEEANNYMTPIIDYKGFSVIRGRKSKEVLSFLKFIIDKKSQIDFCKDLYKFPVNKDAFDILKGKDEYFKTAYRSVEIGKPMPTSAFFKGKYWKGIRTMLTLILTTNNNMDEIITKTQKFMDQK
ncbi:MULTISPECIES: sugar ABC transporter substrate-binding protein [unclassified Marinitoga]|uniref:sugar ABC transporter substrate-binding protein n=1 Tax=unclassified Marinitoga TaxID=2640159 RepID=UPI0006414F7C|nr:MULTISPECIES: extracellular solute-binding protein [unclassified Marinitoga]KLO24266.1 hypothetical protein X274_04150 [Marinitoga sp. 1155]NUV00432.1 hypothetical protein [Marinitoga sp. 1154]